MLKNKSLVSTILIASLLLVGIGASPFLLSSSVSEHPQDSSKSLSLDDWTRNISLVPTFGSFIGGYDLDQVNDVTYDNEGYIIVTGDTEEYSFGFAGRLSGPGGGPDCFVAKIHPDGSDYVWLRFIGGTDGDYGRTVTCDTEGNVSVGGQTYSSNFPTVNGMQESKSGEHDYFIVKLNSTGSIVYSTYLGKSAHEELEAIVVDENGRVYGTGFTDATDWPIVNATSYTGGGRDCTVFILNETGTGLDFSTKIGGSNYEYGNDISIGPEGCVYVTGMSSSSSFPTVNAYDSTQNGGSYYGDCFVFKMNVSTSDFVFSTYLGGTGWESGQSLFVEDSGCVYVTGGTGSSNFPVTRESFGETDGGCFISKFSSNGTELLYSTLLGGNDSDSGSGIAVNDDGFIFVGGSTRSQDFPLVNPHYTTPPPEYITHTFLTVLEPDGANIQYSSYIGSSDYDALHGMNLGSDGSVCLVGETDHYSFPKINAFDTTFGGVREGFIFQFQSIVGLTPRIFSQGDVAIEFGTNITGMNWKVIDDNPDEYKVFRNSTLIDQGDLTSEVQYIFLDFILLDLGFHNITVVATDHDNNTVVNLTWIEVFDQTTTSTTTTTTTIPTTTTTLPTTSTTTSNTTTTTTNSTGLGILPEWVSMTVTITSLGIIVVVSCLIMRSRSNP